MAKTTILLADNDSDFLKSQKELFERNGYRVITASEPKEAKRIIEEVGIDLAVLDLRLLNNNDSKDFSGLNVARESKSSIPKIILSSYPSFEAVREALGPALNGLSPAVDFVSKEEEEALITAVRKALQAGSEFQASLNRLSDQIKEDYEDARQQTKVNFWASLVVSVVGVAVLFTGVALTIGGIVQVGIISAVVGLVAEGVSLLFFKRADSANTRMDKYHLELLETKRFENLLAACDELSSPSKQERVKESAIEAAIKLWLRGNNSQLPVDPKAEADTG